MFDLSPDAEFDQEIDATDANRTPIATYPLLQCPPLAQGLRVALMTTDDTGLPVELDRYTLTSPEPVENLARVRYAAVHAGAKDIAVWL